MNGNIPNTLNNQSGKINFGEIATGIKELLDNFRDFFSFGVSEILDNPEDKNLEDFMLMVSSGAYPQMTDDSKDVFFRKRSYAKDEWCIKLNDFLDLKAIKNLYESRKLVFWTNGCDFSNYRLETEYDGKRLVIVFYNSSDFDRKKLSFEELVEKNEPVRVCLY